MLTKKKILLYFMQSLLLTLFLDYLFGTILAYLPIAIEAIKTLGEAKITFEYLNPLKSIPAVIHLEIYRYGQIVLLLMMLYSFLMKLWKKRNHKTEDASKYGSHGSNRWATKKDIFDGVDIHNQLGKDGLILALEPETEEPMVLSGSKESRKNNNIFIIGGSGSGKSAGYAIPNIINIKEKSIVVTDPKGELYEKTAAMKKAQGYNVRVMNFTDITKSNHYSPFDYIKKDTDAKRVAGTLIMNSGGMAKEQMKGDFWDKAEVALLQAFILYIKHHRPTEEHHFGSVFEMATLPYGSVHALFLELPRNSIAFKAYAQAIQKLDDKVRANVFISLLVSIDLWKYDDICHFTSKSDFDLREIGETKTIVYVIIPIAEEEFRPLICTFFTQLFSELYALADDNFNKLPIKVTMILDEFNNIGKIPNFTERLSTTRSYGIEVCPIVQSIGQMRNRWGQDLTDEIIDNCDTILFLGTNSVTSKEYFSKMLGKTTIVIRGKSESINDKGGSDSSSFSMQGRDLLNPDEIGMLKDEEALVIMRGKYPVRAKKALFFEFPALEKQLLEVVSRKDFKKQDNHSYRVFDPTPILNDIRERQIAEMMREEQLKKKMEKQKINMVADLDMVFKEAGEEALQHEKKTRRKKKEDAEDPLAGLKL